jgi:hypothetical protein
MTSMISKNINNSDYDYMVDYNSDYYPYEDTNNENPTDLNSNDWLELESSLGCYSDSYYESNFLSAEEKYQNWIYSDIDTPKIKKINYPYPMLATGEIITRSKMDLYFQRQKTLALVEEKIVFLQSEIEKHDKKLIELSQNTQV